VRNAVVLSLREPGEIDPRTVLSGPLTSLRRVRLSPGERVVVSADGSEFTLFVLSGSGVGRSGDAEVTLRQGVSVTAPLKTVLKLEAGSEGLEYFYAELAVREDGAG
jgi:mannose-6-phosphate isomerase-like protein (cupin superfamily)